MPGEAQASQLSAFGHTNLSQTESDQQIHHTSTCNHGMRIIVQWCRHTAQHDFIHKGGRGKRVHGNIVAGNVNADKCCDIPDTGIPLMPWKIPFRNHNTELKHLQKMNRNAPDQQQINIRGHPRQPVPTQTPLI